MSEATSAPAPAAPAPATTLLGADPAPAPAAAPAAPAPPAAPAAPAAAPPADPNAPKPADPADPKPADPKDPKADAKPAGAPEKYEAFKLPEGVKADEAVVGEFTTLAKELNLPQEAAQRIVDLQAKVAQKNVEALQQQMTQIFEPVGGTPDKWEALARADKEFGGDKFDENLAAAARARDRFGTPLLKAVLNVTGAGNHPEVLRFFLHVGKAISEDGFVPGRAGTPGGDSIAQRMFPNMNP